MNYTVSSCFHASKKKIKKSASSRMKTEYIHHTFDF